ncbi:Peptidase M15A [Desulfobulbus propionicus DSM 2032]|jgi:uncharacterized protein YcbK (DUF882 family)|uniref:Murein endopeptidase K n=1 Tax=Desulfobulbus propionicus (strain ATCC 33891 / DSM 2032 / VKM B-1956 / 1pr3) TaxID=577650 RepID=A0A7U3YLT5_DESPD|nr:DUF882 domain-containing protein [Desulfobulbus propionicus]ADW17759.1 Peptidase M15A [Desulfobulbus propionicus DSM 2032]
MQHIIFIFLYTVFLLFQATDSTATQPSERFFLMGSGSMHLKNLRNDREARVHLLNPDGSFNERDFATVDWVFGFPTEEKGEHISPRMLFMLSYFAERMAPGKTINIESAYRSPEYNDQIRAQGNNAARTSTHMDGLALDFWLEGVDGKQLWETIRQKNCGGIGHYGGKTVHFDAGRPRFWEAATSGTRSPEPDYNRHLHLATDFDRYRPGEKVRLSLSSVSTFDFGVRPTVQIFRAGSPHPPVATVSLDQSNGTDCVPIKNRKASRFLTATLPPDLSGGRYTLQLTFCNKPFPQMLDLVLSNPVEVRR